MPEYEKDLKELWASFLAEQVVGHTQGTSKAKLETELRYQDQITHFQCNVKNCVQCCCRNQGQKIRLLLQDLALLLDHGYADQIIGTYSSQAEVEKFLKNPVKENIYQTPYLKRKKGADGLEECVFLTKDLQCTIWDKAPFICKTYPLIMNQEMLPEKMVLTFSLDKQCSCTRSEQMQTKKSTDYTKRIINDVICERIEADHTTKLLVNKRAELKALGFGKFL